VVTTVVGITGCIADVVVRSVVVVRTGESDEQATSKPAPPSKEIVNNRRRPATVLIIVCLLTRPVFVFVLCPLDDPPIELWSWLSTGS
jgi:hypothetical protein